MLNLAVLFDHPVLCAAMLCIGVVSAGSFFMAWLTWAGRDEGRPPRRRPARRMPRVRYRRGALAVLVAVLVSACMIQPQPCMARVAVSAGAAAAAAAATAASAAAIVAASSVANNHAMFQRSVEERRVALGATGHVETHRQCVRGGGCSRCTAYEDNDAVALRAVPEGATLVGVEDIHGRTIVFITY
ncbi:hypothetical protein [Nitratidesulfovibrio liaohensis]|uniref:Uncharacterized protein n=1 Tax=Nitratidesulfovibrio liaohensis TaxID=2604158 RepID=A0ABY9QYE7_9BACT|nr:hypothetical protein [Nitratidesulfovibrio liaohensis]WMW64367.1 hypothetical protein KPS_002379 [Nitratidesulfovibrio liaohensis]